MTWLRVEEPIDAGRVVVVATGDRRVAVCNADGEYYAVEDVCTHDGASLDQGELTGHEVECPRHGARFDVRSGRALCLPAVRPVKTYRTRVQDDIVEVEIP